MRTATTELEAPLDLVLLPVTFGLRSGTMRLADGRLTYTRTRRQQVVFDAPLDEFHSFARSSMGTGFHLWHGSTRYRFVSYHPVLPAEYGSSLVANAAESVVQMRQGLAKTALSRADGGPLARRPRAGDRPGAADGRRGAAAAHVGPLPRRDARARDCRDDRSHRDHHGDRADDRVTVSCG